MTPETKTMTLTEFLLARIAEDEAVARRGVSEGSPYFEVRGWAWWDDDFGGYHLANYQGVGREPVGESWRTDVGMPARVLAECEAKRRIVSDASYVLDHHERHGYDGATRALAAGALRHLAAIYADHPDCHDEWRP
jgi:hypothetical protein